MYAVPPRRPPADAPHVAWRMPKPLRFTARAFAEALFASDDGPPDAARLDWLLDEVEDFLARSGFRAQAVFQASMLALATTAPLTIGKPVPLPLLDWRERIHAIERFERTPLGLAVLGAKAMLCLVWYEHPEAAKEIGFDGRCLDAGHAWSSVIERGAQR